MKPRIFYKLGWWWCWCEGTSRGAGLNIWDAWEDWRRKKMLWRAAR